MDNQINETELRKAIALLKPAGELFEIRIVPTAKNQKVRSGYFYSADEAVENLKKMDLKKSNVYITLGAIKPELFGREQSNKFVQGATTTSDNDIVGYRWLLVDLDPKRSSGISSSEEELKASFDLAKRVYEHLKDLGFGEPVKAVSGNGSHLLYKIQLANTEENRSLVERCLKALDALFSTDKVDVDTSTFNPSRISKLYGTLAQKGANIPERPHRMSRIISDKATLTDITKLEALASMYKVEQEKPQEYNKYKPSDFDVEDWLNKHGIGYKEASYKGGKKYVLDECPFCFNKAPDSAVFVTPTGALGFRCLHNRCTEKDWKDFRLKYEPTAYDNKQKDNHIEEGWESHNRDKKQTLAVDAPYFETALDIVNQPEKRREFIKTGINKLDKKLRGLEKGKLTILTGLRGGSKSTILSQFLLEAIKDGHTCIAYSGELSDKSFLDWLTLQAAGAGYVKEDSIHEGFYFVEKEIERQIAEWIGDRFYLYNNLHGHAFTKLQVILRDKVIETKADLLVIDNLMALDISGLDQYDKYEAQTNFVKSLKALAMETNCHIVVVAHPRKALGLLRLDDVSGSGNLTNYADNALIVHRVNQDFKNNAKKMFGWKDNCYQFNCTNIVEVAKDRENGTQDFWIDLYFEPQTKRLKNHKVENKWYGWKKEEVAEENSYYGFLGADDIEF